MWQDPILAYSRKSNYVRFSGGRSTANYRSCFMSWENRFWENEARSEGAELAVSKYKIAEINLSNSIVVIPFGEHLVTDKTAYRNSIRSVTARMSAAHCVLCALSTSKQYDECAKWRVELKRHRIVNREGEWRNTVLQSAHSLADRHVKRTHIMRRVFIQLPSLVVTSILSFLWASRAAI